MKCSLDISNFLEEISSLSHSIVFLYFFALITEEGFFYLSLLFFGILYSDGFIFPFLPFYFSYYIFYRKQSDTLRLFASVSLHEDRRVSIRTRTLFQFDIPSTGMPDAN